MRWIGKLLLAALALAGAGHAAPYVAANGQRLEVDYWAGSGANEAIIVTDFHQGASDTYAFGYRWDGAADGGDAFTAVVAAGALDASITNWGGPPPDEDLFVNSITYQGVTLANNQDPPYSPAWIYWTDEDVQPGEPIEWTHMEVGMSNHPLVDGGFEGWVFSDDVWPNYVTTPRLPTVAAELQGGEADLVSDPDGFPTGGYTTAGMASGPAGGPVGLDLTVELQNLVLDDPDRGATLLLYYSEEELRAKAVIEETLRLYWWDALDELGAGPRWYAGGTRPDGSKGEGLFAGIDTDPALFGLGTHGIDTAGNFVWANINHASVYGIGGQTPEPGSVALLAMGAAGLLARRRKKGRGPRDA